MTLATYDYWISLLFDEAMRNRFVADPAAALRASNLSEGEQRGFAQLDPTGLQIDARGRAQYLMRALCRPYPFTTACLGTAFDVPQRLRSFLKRIPSVGNTRERTFAFGAFLDELVCDNPWNAGPVVVELVRSVLAFELSLAKNAVQCRKAVQRGQPPAAIEKYSASAAKRRKLVLPAFMLVAELPQSFEVLANALGNPTPENVWDRVETGVNLDFHRLESVARGSTLPVTAVARAQILGCRGSGAVPVA